MQECPRCKWEGPRLPDANGVPRCDKCQCPTNPKPKEEAR